MCCSVVRVDGTVGTEQHCVTCFGLLYKYRIQYEVIRTCTLSCIEYIRYRII
jgi:hypothetical protein